MKDLLLTKLVRLENRIRSLDKHVTTYSVILKYKKSRVAACRRTYAKQLEILETYRHSLHTVDCSDLSEPEKSTLFKEIDDCINKIWSNVLGGGFSPPSP